MRARHRGRRRRQAPALRRGRRHATGQGRREQCRGTSHVRSGGTIASPPRFHTPQRFSCRQRSRHEHLWPQHRSRGQAPPPTPQHQPQPPHASSLPPRRRWHLCPRRQRARRARHRACSRPTSMGGARANTSRCPAMPSIASGSARWASSAARRAAEGAARVLSTCSRRRARPQRGGRTRSAAKVRLRLLTRRASSSRSPPSSPSPAPPMGPSCVACLCDELVSHIPATSPSFPTRLQKRPCSRARSATAPGRFGPGSTFVRSRSKFATAGGGSPWAVVVDAWCALAVFLAFTAILYTELHHSVTEHLDRARCVDTPGELHATAAHPQRAPLALGGASGRQPAPEAERSSIRTRNGPVLLKTKSPKCSLCRRTAGSFERKRSLEPSNQRRRRSVRAFPFCCLCELSLLWHWTRSRSAWTAHRATAATSRVMLRARDMPAQPSLFQRTVSS